MSVGIRGNGHTWLNAGEFIVGGGGGGEGKTSEFRPLQCHPVMSRTFANMIGSF